MDNNKKKIGTLKAKITRQLQYVTQTYATLPLAVPLKSVLDQRMEYIDSAWQEFEFIHGLIIEATAEDDVQAEDNEFADYEEKYFEVKRKLYQLIQAAESAETNQDDNGQQEQNGPPVNPRSAAANVKLPRLDLPKFSGNILEWTSFHDLFTSMVHNQPISNSQKLHYLKTSVSGEAASLIQSIDVTDANYEEAWKLLRNRYQNERQLIQCHLQFLFSQNQLKEESSPCLRKLIDNTTKGVRALHVMGQPTDEWGPILVYLVTDRMDSESRKQWELTSPGTDFPTFESLKQFIEQRCRALDAAAPSKNKLISRPSAMKIQTSTHIASITDQCVICRQQHQIQQCEKFLSMDQRTRSSYVKKEGICFNCLRASHPVRNCTSKSTCRKCGQRHHTLLHIQAYVRQADNTSSDARSRPAQQQGVRTGQEEEPLVVSNHSNNADLPPVLLSTAVVAVQDRSQAYQPCRILIDGGSQASFISESCFKKLGLIRRRTSILISGIGNNASSRAKGIAELILKSRFSDFKLTVDCLIIPKVTGTLPSCQINIDDWSHIRNIDLADPSFNLPGPIDILLGADAIEDVMTEGKVSSLPFLPSARNSHLGWIVSGRVRNHLHSHVISNVSVVEVEDQLRRFWEVEEIPASTHLTMEEEASEQHFVATHSRDVSGRFTAPLPFKSNDIGLSKSLAYRRLLQVEKRLLKEPDYRAQYEDFMLDYLKLGHMEMIPETETTEVIGKTNYLPHHFVLKASSTTTKFRVVFDASAKTSNGRSLNSNLMVGPTIQDDMFSILIRFRQHRYAYTADIAKMYRQILVPKEEADYLRILWRKDFTEPIREYRLLTVSYGTASAPFTATRTLKQIAEDEGERYPLAKQILCRDFYVDDLMSGNDSIEEALQTQQELNACLASAGMELRKWSSNDPRIRDAVTEDLRETCVPITLDADNSIKALGLSWNTTADTFHYQVKLQDQSKFVKRSILSEVAKLYDPMGWISPVVIRGKMFLQTLWISGTPWDAELPQDTLQKYVDFRNDLPELNQISIPRYIALPSSSYQLHGFSDASEMAYAAVLYLRSESQSGEVKVRLICSKSKVSPVKKLSIPKLELCGALLLSRLIKKVKSSLLLPVTSITAYTDSTITLSWIKGLPSRWKTFVANRVAEIQDQVPPSGWRHVPGAQNPADMPSRGTTAAELVSSSLWWQDPSWLEYPEDKWPQTAQHCSTDLEAKPVTSTVHHGVVCFSLIYRYSSLTELLRVTAWIRRFIKNAATPSNRITGCLTAFELATALTAVLKITQAEAFPEVIKSLSKKKPISSTFLALNPFVDENGLIRVGGRLKNSDLEYNQKYPILLPKRHAMTSLIISYEHTRLLHAGVTLMLSNLQQRYWILGARSQVRHQVRTCVTCIRHRSTTMQQMMGDLPRDRVTPSRPFQRCGVDFGGPFITKTMRGRGGKLVKSYICLFVCLSTKAVHIEVASDLSTDTFLAALRRLVARRGRITDVYSDNGTNFVGANQELKNLMSQVLNQSMIAKLVDESIQWHFIPPRGPHFGGIWEAGIKSAKHHLKRVVGDTALTFEELNTLVTQIEGCLNSRPLVPISSDPSDMQVLTPSHFLIGDSITSIPEPNLTDLRMNRLSRWQLTQQLQQHFWKKWQADYLNTLQQRTKWKTPDKNLSVGDLVIIKEDNLPACKWMMGRVEQTHPGADRRVRVATIKTVLGISKRPISKLVLLLSDDS